ncbi:Uncharacterised protein [Acinetobacter baumannii]|nr:Uncharacterised protein [Acinetobacter baumannii]
MARGVLDRHPRLQRPRRQYFLGIRTGRDPLRVPQRPHYPLHPGGRDPRPVPGPQARRTRRLPGLRSRSGAPRTSAERGRVAQPAAQRDPAQRVLLADLQLHRQRRAVRPAGRPGGLRRRAGGGQAGLQDPSRLAIQRRLSLQRLQGQQLRRLARPLRRRRRIQHPAARHAAGVRRRPLGPVQVQRSHRGADHLQPGARVAPADQPAATRQLRHQLPRAGPELHLPGRRQRLLPGAEGLLRLRERRRRRLQERPGRLRAERHARPEVRARALLELRLRLVAVEQVRLFRRLLPHPDR